MTTRNRISTFVAACALATAGLFATAAPAQAACATYVPTPGLTMVNGQLHVFAMASTAGGCDYGAWQVSLARTRWNGPETVAVSPYWYYDGTGRATYPCNGTHTWWALLQKNGGNHKFSSSTRITC